MKKVKLLGQIKYPKERLLFELYRMRGLTIRQIGKAIFGSYDYAFEYMLKLEKEGLVRGKVYNAGMRRLGKFYTVTDKGNQKLVSANLLEEPSRSLLSKYESYTENIFETPVTSDEVPFAKPKLLSAHANNQDYDKNKAVYTLLTNELYAHITSYGMYWFDAREWKVRNSLNRSAIVRGGFQALDKEEYAMYMLFSPEQYKTASVGIKMLTRIYEEITLNEQKGKFVIYVYNEERYEWIMKMFRKMQFYAKDVHIIKHDNGLGYDKLLLLSEKNRLREKLEAFLKIPLTELNYSDPAERFAHFETFISNEKYYLMNFLTHNEGMLNRLQNELLDNTSLDELGFNVKKAKNVAIIAWSTDKALLNELFKNYTNVRIKYIDPSYIEDLLSAEPKLLCETDIWKKDSQYINEHRKETYVI